jgi:two-component system nitrate/nitrite response regulator NarL
MTFSCLIVDDSAEFLASAARLLRAEGVAVLGEARNGSAAIELAARLKPDVILVDVELGDEDGVEVAAALAAPADAPAVILISSHDRDGLRELLKPARVLGFIAKDVLSASAIAVLLL